MADGTNAGSIFIDLIVRNTVDKQVQNIASQAQTTAQKAFSGVEKAAENAANKAAVSATKATESVSSALSQSTDKQVALAQAKVKELEREYERINRQFADAVHSYSSNEDGDKANDKLTERLAAQRAAAYDKVIAARERLAVYVQLAAEKEATAEDSAAQKEIQAEEKKSSRKKSIWASLWKNMLSTAGSAAKTIGGKISSIANHFTKADKSSSRFTNRLKGIVGSALIFNGLSSGLRKMTGYISETLVSTGEMSSALSNLKGAAANAASPIIQVLTPALTALANAAATVFTYVSSLLTLLTGKISNASATATKSASGAASAAKKLASLAGFDEISKLDSSDSSGGGSGSASPNYDFEGQSSFMDSIMAAVEAGQWDQIGVLIAQKLNSSLEAIPWPNIQEKARTWTQNIVQTLNGFVGELDWNQLGSTVGNGLNTITTVIDTFFQNFDWVSLGSGFASGLSGLLETVDWNTLGRTLTDKLNALFGLLDGFLQTFDFSAFGKDLADMIMSAVGNIDWSQAGKDASKFATGLLSTITTFLEEIDWQQVGSDVEDFLGNIDWGGIISGISEGIGAAIGGLGAAIWEIIEDEWDGMIDTWTENTELCGGDVVAGLLLGIINAIADIGTWIYDNVFDPFLEGIKEAFGIHSPSTVMEEQGGFIIQGLLNGILKPFEDIGNWVDTNILTPLKNAFAGESAGEVKVDVKNDSGSWWSNIKTWWSEKTSGQSAGSFGVSAKNGSKTWWSDVKTWWSEKTSGQSAGSFGVSAKNGSKTWWSDVKKWWSEKTGSSNLSVGLSIKNSATSWWNDVKNWWKKAVGKLETKLDIKLPKISIDWKETTVLGKQFKYPTGFDIKWNEYGAILDGAQLFGMAGNTPLGGGEAGREAVLPLDRHTWWMDDIAERVALLLSKQPATPLMVGYSERSTATSNSPAQSSLMDSISVAMEDMVQSNIAGHEATVAVLREILEAILGIQIGDEVIARAVTNYQRKMAVARGG